jgi:hypothetical protein
VFACILVWSLAAPTTMASDPPDPKDEARKQRLAFYGGGATLVVARNLKVEQVMGKAVGAIVTEKPPVPEEFEHLVEGAPVAATSGSITDEPGESENNQAIRDFPNVSENEPAVVANPKDPDHLVAGTHFIGSEGNRCVAHYSKDGGKSWNQRPIFMPQLTHQSECSDPVLAWAPDGSRVYYAYMDIKFDHFDIVVSYSDDDGRSWKGPVVALANVSADYDKPWIGTHVRRSSDSNSKWVYVSATRFDFTGPCHIDFTRSSNKALTWSAPQTLDTSGGVCGSGASPVVQGSRPTGGKDGDVLVAWYHSGADGWLTGSFEIRTRYSSNNGASFSPIVVSALDTTELPFFLGPGAAYHRWWGGMFPDVEIAPNGTGHVAYIHDPVPGSATEEEGDVRYVSSGGPPYTSWTTPVRVNDDSSGKAQGWVAIDATSSGGSSSKVYALWEDHRTSATDNRFYDIFAARRTGGGWGSNQKVTDDQSTSDFIFLGDYFDITAIPEDDHDDDDIFVYGVWTDRRDEPDIFDFDDDIWGGRIFKSFH